MGKEKGYRYAKLEREKLLAAYHQSGMSINRFCEQAEVSYATMVRWLRGSRESEEEVKLIEVEASFSKRSTLTIRLPNGIECELRESLSLRETIDWIRELSRC